MARRRQSLLLLGERADHERNEQFYTRHGVPLEQLVAEGAKLVRMLDGVCGRRPRRAKGGFRLSKRPSVQG